MRSRRLDHSLELALKHLSELRVDFALIGGLAVTSHTEPRFTRDIDFAVAAGSDALAEQIVHSLVKFGYQIGATLEHTRSGQLATVRLTHAEEPRIFVDLLFASCGIEREIVQHARPLQVLGQTIKVATIGHLIATKILSESKSRTQDRTDLINLLKVAGGKDLKMARRALTLIEKRGFHRGKNLIKKLDHFLKRYGRSQ